MPMMKAIRFYDKKKLKLEKVPFPEVKDNQVLIKVKRTTLSQTILNEYMYGPILVNKEPHPLTKKGVPLILGHSFGGVIEGVGKNISSEIIGKKISVLPLKSCGECRFCKMGEDNLCENLAYYGLIGLDGGLAEYAVVDIENIYFMDKYSDDKFTIVEPLLISLNAYFSLKRYKEDENHISQKVLILGSGMLGISLAIVWNILSPEDTIYINDLYASRLGKASELFWESDIFVNTISKEKLRYNYYDIVIDTAGIEPLSVKPAFLEGLRYLRKGGIILTLGMYYNSVEIPFTEFFVNHKNFINNAFYSKNVIPELTYILNRINFDFDKVSEKIKLDDVLTEGIYKLQLDKDYFLRLEVEC